MCSSVHGVTQGMIGTRIFNNRNTVNSSQRPRFEMSLRVYHVLERGIVRVTADERGAAISGFNRPAHSSAQLALPGPTMRRFNDADAISGNHPAAGISIIGPMRQLRLFCPTCTAVLYSDNLTDNRRKRAL